MYIKVRSNYNDQQIVFNISSLCKVNQIIIVNLYMFIADGVSLFTSSKKGSLWPVYLAINELPIKLR